MGNNIVSMYNTVIFAAREKISDEVREGLISWSWRAKTVKFEVKLRMSKLKVYR